MLEQILLLNNSKWLAGAAMLLVNLGSRYIQADLGKTHELIFSNPYFKKIIIFALFFMATRDMITAFLLTLIYIFIIDGVLHNDRKFCIIPKKFIPSELQPIKSDYDKAKEIIHKYESFVNSTNSLDESVYSNYLKKFNNVY